MNRWGILQIFMRFSRQMGVPPGCMREPGRVRLLGTQKSRFPDDLAPLADELIE